MDVLGIGTDIVECLRIRRMIEKHGELFLARVFTDREMRYCQRSKNATEHFAGRWAAKEAVLKCLGTGWSKGLCWTDIEVANDPAGKPAIRLHAATSDHAQTIGIRDVMISISHCRAYAVAYALALGQVPAATKGPRAK
jgi:holo-[acyl-carrier protein] synthase